MKIYSSVMWNRYMATRQKKRFLHGMDSPRCVRSSTGGWWDGLLYTCFKTVNKSDPYILAGMLLFTMNVDCSTPAFCGYRWQNAASSDMGGISGGIYYDTPDKGSRDGCVMPGNFLSPSSPCWRNRRCRESPPRSEAYHK